jgi:hypothetical protein
MGAAQTLWIAIVCVIFSPATAVTFGRRQTAQLPVENFAPALVSGEQEPHFWYNYVTQETTYTRPTILPLLSAEHNNRPYWVVNGQPTWEKPADADWRELRDIEDRSYFRNDLLDLTTWDRPAALGWRKLSVDKFFLLNTVTGETKWPEAAPELGTLDPKTKQRYYVDASGKPTWTPQVKEAAWRKAFDDKHNRDYYWNTMTNERSWTLPAESHIAWVMQPKNLEF